MPLAGGPAITIGEWPGGTTGGATWGPDDTIVLGTTDGLWSMPVSGLERTQLTTLTEEEAGHTDPRFLPSGDALLFSVVFGFESGESQVAVYDFDTDQRKFLLAGTSPQFAVTGHLSSGARGRCGRYRSTLTV